MINSSHFHPMLVHFPIALILAGFLFDVLALVFKKEACLSKAGFWLLLMGAAGALFAFGSGYFLTSPMEWEAGLMRERHETYAALALIMIVLTAIARIVAIYLDKRTGGVKLFMLFMYFASVLLISVTGFLGGKLVMDFMIGL